jgi:hypothetical protein
MHLERRRERRQSSAPKSKRLLRRIYQQKEMPEKK